MAGTGDAHLRGGDADLVLSVSDLVMEFPLGEGRKVHAVSGISFDLVRGETLGVVGESGSGKSTTGRAVMQLPSPTSGSIVFEGRELTEMSNDELRKIRPRIQMVFQDPVSSLNPRRRVTDIVAEPLRVWKGSSSSRADKVAEVLDAVGLDVAKVGDRRPHEFSGGQCQRISIARSLVLDPELLICDEPVSALDVSVQAQILNLLKDAKERYGLTMVFIAHDLGVVKNISNRVAVMYLGKLCETGDARAVYANPAHPYTAALLESVPVPDPDVRPVEREVVATEIPSPMNPPSGCRFRTRCPQAADICATDEPVLRAVGTDQFVACHFPLQPVPVGVA
ncbi:MAG: oligopeptide/dipeptide ABC transporter ATP-binding protein [Ilumatobacteraceae bacterium]